jgi:hypothetical protein
MLDQYFIQQAVLFTAACCCLMKIHALRPSGYVMYHQVPHIIIYPQSAFVCIIRFSTTTKKQYSRCKFNVTWSRVRATNVTAEERRVLHNLIMYKQIQKHTRNY